MWRDFKGMRFTLNEQARDEFDCIFCPTECRKGLGFVGLSTGGNSGHQAVNLAFLLGAKRIWLLGFDMGAASSSHNHFFGNHKGRDLTNPNKSLYRDWRKKFDEMAAALAKQNVELLNLSRKTALSVPRGNVDDL